MAQKQKLLYAAGVLATAVLACQAGLNPLPNRPAGAPTQPAAAAPTQQASAPSSAPQAAGADVSGLPSGFLADPDTACVTRHFDGLSCLDRDGWHAYGREAFKAPVRLPYRMAGCPDGSVYFYEGAKLYLLKAGALTGLAAQDLPDLEFPACGPGNDFWAGYMDGAGHWSGSAWSDYPATRYLGIDGPGDMVNALVIAPDGKVWAATEQNIAVFDGTAWQVLRSGGVYHGLAVDANGKVWVVDDGGSQSHLLAYDGSDWLPFPLPTERIRFIALDRENTVWAATPQNQIYSLDAQAGRWKLLAGTPKFGDGRLYAIRALRFDRQDRLWVASSYGLFVYKAPAWTDYRMDNADLFANDLDEIVFFGQGPALPEPAPKAPGSVSGRLLNPREAKLRVEICLYTPEYGYSGATPCAEQAYHALTTLGADGTFLFKDVRAGKYHLMVETARDTWGSMIGPSTDPFGPNPGLEFEVKAGTETVLGDISFPAAP